MTAKIQRDTDLCKTFEKRQLYNCYSYKRFSRSGIAGASIADDLLKKYGVIALVTTQELYSTTHVCFF